jgi:F-type H+-transporting ATPase subunit alpha
MYAGVRGFLDKMKTNQIKLFEPKFLNHIKTNHSGLINRIRDTGALSPADDAELKNILDAFIPESGLEMKA